MNQTTELKKLSSLSKQELKNELARGLQITAKHLRHLATIWRELENRGEDLSDIRHGLMSYLPAIANGVMEPQLIVNYAGHKTLLSALSSLPIENQQKIAETGFVTVVTEDGDEVETPVNKLRASEINRIFDISSRKIRSTDEQRSLLMTASKKKTLRRPVTSIVGFDSQDGGELLVISGKRVNIWRVLDEIARKYPEKACGLKDISMKFK